ncbi:MAG: hypothetical protein PHN99_08400 [Eubacteriales bacterium]|nr:hypothetical protein [Eubacteriales bacterium]
MIRYARGTVLQSVISSSKHDCREFCDVPYLEAVAVHNAGDRDDEVVVFAVNRSTEDSLVLECDMRSFGSCDVSEHIVYEDAGIPHSNGNTDTDDGMMRAILGKSSWNVIRIRVDKSEYT